MSLIQYIPKGLMPWRDFDRIFDRFFAAPWPETNAVTAWSPAVDIEETDKEIILTADLPDVDEKDLAVKVEDDVLTLKAERKFEKESKKENFHRRERAYGSFQRSFGLPEGVNVDKIGAKYNKGVLRVTLPKAPEKQKKMRRIEVR